MTDDDGRSLIIEVEDPSIFHDLTTFTGPPAQGQIILDSLKIIIIPCHVRPIRIPRGKLGKKEVRRTRNACDGEFPGTSPSPFLARENEMAEKKRTSRSAQSQSLAEGVDKELTCAICLSRYNQPKILPCLHSYCKGYLEDMLKKSHEKKSITCPQCKVVHELPLQGIDGFTTFFTINNLLELLHIHENAATETPIQSIKCSSGLDENPAIARCLTCSDYLCESCCTIHRKQKVTKAHVVKTLKEIKQSDKKSGVKSLHKKQYCEEHEDELLKIYCKTCKKVMCLLCAVVTHKNHEYVVISAVRPELQKQLEKQISEVKVKEVEFQNHQKYTENLLRISNEAAKSSEKEINKAFSEVIAAVEARQAQLLAKVRSIHESEVKQITAESESLACSLSRLSGSIQFTKQLLNNGDDVEVAAVSDQTAQTLSSLTKMTWDTRMLKPSLLRPKFEPIKETIHAFGKIVSAVEPSDIILTNMPVDVLVGSKSNCEVRLSEDISRRGYEAALKVTISHSDTSVLKSTMIKKKDFNSWTVFFTPDKVGDHVIKVQIGSVSLTQPFVVKLKINMIKFRSDI